MQRQTPFMLNLENKKGVIVGGGDVAARKFETLAEAGADITIISPDLHPALQTQRDHFNYQDRSFQKGDTQGAFVVVAATDNQGINHAVYQDARDHVPLINVVDQPELCTFTFPSVVQQGSLTIAISTSGVSPALSKKIRLQLEEMYGPEYEAFLEKLSLWRREIIRQVDDPEIRRKLFQAIVQDEVIEDFRHGDSSLLEEKIRDVLKGAP
ncbi:MAG: bifunctional precorrin-2 dehydrogenase/sirohydrochlorin ferrochelatase [Bacillaceae bacterium]|nr:bifunctional precorrin-2 dehydrogenase/sirohydrochlorin ferrochelatase [Bacillaceae bacterium]